MSEKTYSKLIDWIEARGFDRLRAYAIADMDNDLIIGLVTTIEQERRCRSNGLRLSDFNKGWNGANRARFRGKAKDLKRMKEHFGGIDYDVFLYSVRRILAQGRKST